MADAVEEVGIAERDVLGAGGHLRADVFEHNVCGHDAELPAVDGDDGTVAAQMFAAAARLRIPDGPSHAGGELQ